MTAGAHSPPTSQVAPTMTDVDVLIRLLYAIDRLGWREVRDCLADHLRVDYTDLFGGEPETLPAEDLVHRWRALVPGFDATQHLTGPVVLTNDGGPGLRADTHVRGYHHIGNQTWSVNGHYIARIRDGKITELTLQVFYQEGNIDLSAIATKRASSSPREARKEASNAR